MRRTVSRLSRLGLGVRAGAGRALLAVLLPCAALTPSAGCGGDGASGNPDANGDGAAGEPDAHNGDCEAGGRAGNDRYLPYDVGNVWRYRVTKVATGEVTTKRQELTETMTPEGETEPVIVQLTTKPNGTAETWNRKGGDVVYRIKQIDRDGTGAIERQNAYTPDRLRLDESAARITDGATWTEEFDSIEYDAVGVETGRVAVTETWTIAGVDEACESPLGTFRCLHVQRTASDADGGSVMKDYWFARGLGKVREEGDAREELIGCLLE